MQVQEKTHSIVIPEKIDTRWSWARRVIFRFIFIYFVLYNLPFPFGWIPATGGIAETYLLMWHNMVPWVGRYVLRLSQPITVFTNASGDTTYDYVLALCFLWIAFVGTLVWSLVDRRSTNYERLDAGFRTGIRLVLAGTMMLFGSVKIFQVQFPEPSLSKLLQSFGDSSPLGLLWTFMGASRPYMVFTGCVEMLAGALLIFPQLALLGALLSTAAIANVFMLNMSYDVPVKLYSFHILAMAVLLSTPHIRRLANFFVFNHGVQPIKQEPLFRQPRANQFFLATQILFGLYIACNSLYQAHKVDGHLSPKTPLYGIWSVEEIVIDGEAQPALPNNELAWRRVVFDDSENVSVQQLDGETTSFRLEMDEAASQLKFTKNDNSDWRASFILERPLPESIVLNGQANGKALRVKMRRGQYSFLMKNRGFHWINEHPVH
jgi:hypothetical protein